MNILKFSAMLTFIMSPMVVPALYGQFIAHWNDMQMTGAMMLGCIFCPLLMGVVMAFFPTKGGR